MVPCDCKLLGSLSRAYALALRAFAWAPKAVKGALINARTRDNYREWPTGHPGDIKGRPDTEVFRGESDGMKTKGMAWSLGGPSPEEP